VVVIDIETTGLDPCANAIIEIGAIDFYNPKNRFNQRCRIRENSIIDNKALMVNGFDETELKSKDLQSERSMLVNFIQWLGEVEDRTLAGQNVNFDLEFLKATASREKIKWDFGRRVVDLHSIAYSHAKKNGICIELENQVSNFNGDMIMEYVGIPKEPRPHRGINGAIYNTEALFRLIFNKGCFEEFSQYPLKN